MSDEIKFPKPYKPSEEDLKNIIAPTGLEESSDYIELEDYYAKTFFVFTYPRYLSSGWFSSIINMAEMMDISIFVHPMNTSRAMKNLQKKLVEVESEISERREKGLIRDPKLETARNDIEKLRDSLRQGTDKLFNVGVYITIYGSTQEELEELEQKIESELESKMVYIKPALFRQLEGFKSTLPISQDELSINTPLNTGPASSLFPFVSPDLTSEEGILYGVNMHNNTLVIFDRFNLENANSVIFATSGAGKSYAAKLEILRSMMMGTDVLVIDPENEYKSLANAVGGTFFNISLTSDENINPFDIPIVPEDEDPENVFRSHILNLTGLIKLMLGEITPEEDALLDKAITQTYEARDITPENFGNISREEMNPPLLEDLQTVLENTEGGSKMATRLNKYVEGSYAGFTNEPTNIDIGNRFIVFSIRDLEEELRPIAMYIVLNFIWNLVSSDLQKRILLIDEAWWMMKHQSSASFLFSLVKRARKYHLGVTTITQDVEDFLNSEYGKPIISNSAMQLLMKQAPLSIESLSDTFGLTEAEKNFLLEADVGEGLFFVGLKHVAMKVVASYTEDQIITTDPEQMLELE
ncbi:MAG: VirB4-like conjugal transfer ATPase, CD1110 family [Candidatus Magasanikbacteria bacterium]